MYNDKHFSKIIIRHWKKNIFKKCNFLIIIFFSQIAQATTLEKFNVTCFLRGWHNKNISVCSIFSNHNGWNETLLVFRVLFSRIFFKPQRLKYFATCFPRIIFLYLFKSQRLKFWLSLCKIVRSSVILLLPLFEILRYLCDVIKHLPVFFQKQIHFRHRIYFLQVLYFIYFYYKMYQ